MIVGLLKEMVLTYYYGATSVSDAYILSQEIPMFLMGIIGSTIYVSYVPIASRLASESKNKMNAFTKRVLIGILLISIILLLVNNLLVDYLIKLFAYDFSVESVLMTKNMLKITFFSGYFYLTVQVLIAYLRINNIFYTTQLSNIYPKLILIVTMILSSFYSIKLLPIGILLSVIVQFSVLIFYTRKFSLISEKVENLISDNVYKMMTNSLPLLVSGLIIQLNTVIDRTLSSSFGDGSISIITYAIRLTGFIITIFITPIVAVFFPTISKLIANNEKGELQNTIKKNILFSLYLVVPSAFGVVIFSNEIVSFVYGRGNFVEEDVIITALVLSTYSLTLITNVLTTILGNIFFSYNDTKTPMIIGFATVSLNIILSLILSKVYGFVGLPLATSISSILAVILHSIFIKKYLVFTEKSFMLIEFFKILFSSLVMSVFFLIVKYSMQVDVGLFGIPLGALLYFFTTLILKAFVFDELKSYLIKNKE